MTASSDRTLDTHDTLVAIDDGRVSMSADGEATLRVVTPGHTPLDVRDPHVTIRVTGDDYRADVELDGEQLDALRDALDAAVPGEDEHNDVSVVLAGEGAAEVPTDPDTVRVAFAGVPRTDPNEEWTRDLARKHYPPAVVPDTGPVPDPQATLDVAPAVTVPPWILATAAYQVVRHGESDRTRVLDFLNERVAPEVAYRTPSGADAVDAIIGAVDELDDIAAAFGAPPETDTEGSP